MPDSIAVRWARQEILAGATFYIYIYIYIYIKCLISTPQQGQRCTRVLSPRAHESHRISYPICAGDSFLEMNFPAREIKKKKMCGAVTSSTPYVAITFTQLAALINFCIISRWKDCQTFFFGN